MWVAILLLPLCVGMGRALWSLIQEVGLIDTTLFPLVAGVFCMVILYLSLPKPTRIYVFGHEFTHALATMICGGRVREMKVGAESGHVLVSKDNFFITLAPYFVPLYTVFALVIFAVVRSLGYWQGDLAWGVFCWALGVTYAFHILLTIQILKIRQPDITSQGYLFSSVVIFMGNALVLLGGIPVLLDGPELGDVGMWVIDGTGRTLGELAQLGRTAWEAGNSALN